MILLKKLILKDFMSINEADIDFINGVTLISGENGLGKSAPIDAIAVCLMDGFRRSDTMLDYVQKGKPRAFIKLWLDYSGEEVFFDISINKEKGNTFQRAITYKDKIYEMGDASELLEALDFKYYSDILLTMQDTDNITKLSPTQRANYLQKLLNFDFAEQLSIIESTLSDLEEKKRYNENQVEYQTKEIFTRKSEIKQEIPQTITLEEYEETVNSFEKVQEDIKELRKQDTLKSTKRQRVGELLRNVSDIKIKLADLNNKKIESSKIQDKLEKTQESLQEVDKEYINIQDKLSIIKSGIEKAKQLSDDVQDTITKESNSSLIIKEKIRNNEERLKLAQANFCPTCNQSTKSIDVSAINIELSELSTSLQLSEKTLSEVLIEKTKLNTVKEESETSLKNWERQEIVNRTKQKDFISEIEKLTLKQQDSVITRNDLIEIAKLEKEKAEIEKEYLELNEQLSVLDNEQMDLSELEKQEHSYSLKIKTFTDEISKNEFIKTHNEEVKEAIKVLEEAIDTTKENTAVLNKDIMLNLDAKKIITKDLSNYLIVKTCKALETVMNDFMQVVFPNMEVRLYQSKKGVEFFYTLDKSSLTDKTTKSDLINVKMASGFQKEILSIAFRVSLCKAYNIPLLILDECDKAASDDSSSKLFEAILGDGIFKQVLIITHKPAVKDFIMTIADDIKVLTPENGVFVEID